MFLAHPAGFVDVGALPYIIAVGIIATTIGVFYASASLVASIVIILYVAPAAAASFQLPAVKSELSTVNALVIALGFAVDYAFAAVLHAGRHERERMRGELSKKGDDVVRLEWTNAAVESSLRELRNRIATESASFATLYDVIPRLHARRLDDILEAALDSIALLTRATRIAIYEFVQDELVLRIRKYRSDSAEQPPTTLPVSSSIEGWVIRHGVLFSARMLLESPELRENDDGRVIMSAPIVSLDSVWGVATIEAMPFASYHEFSEKALQIVLELTAPALRNAVSQFASLAAGDSEGNASGEPSDGAVTLRRDLDTFLEGELAAAAQGRTDLAVVLVEVINLADVPQLSEEKQLAALMEDVGNLVNRTAGNSALVFAYKRPEQIAAVLPVTSAGSAIVVARQVVDSAAQRAWTAGDEAAFIELAVGTVTARETGYSRDRMLSHAEHMLNLQRELYREIHPELLEPEE